MLTQSSWSNGGRTRDRALTNSCWRESDVAYISSSKWLHSFKTHHDFNKAISGTTRRTSYCFLEGLSKNDNQNTAAALIRTLRSKANICSSLVFRVIRESAVQRVHEWIWMGTEAWLYREETWHYHMKAMLYAEHMLTFTKQNMHKSVAVCKFTSGLRISASPYWECITCLWWHTYPDWRSQSYPACLAPQTAGRPTGRRRVWAACSPEMSAVTEKGLSAGSILHMATRKLKPVLSTVQSYRAEQACLIRCIYSSIYHNWIYCLFKKFGISGIFNVF